MNADFISWVIARFATKKHISDFSSCENPSIPSFTATNSLIYYKKYPLTHIAFTPIIPHPATKYDTISTCMKNFQDVLAQNELAYSPLWFDEGVYQIAKELQLLNPDGFGNIFLDLWGFHLGKIIIACIGKFLEESGVESVFVENEIFGLGVVKTVMNGGHYVRGKCGMGLISEALHQLQLIEFIKVTDCSQFQGLLENIAELQMLSEKEMLHQRKIQRKWRQCKEKMSDFMKIFDKYKEEGKLKSEQFQYWNKFLEEIFPILRDLTRSHREGNWKLHLSAVHRSLSLFFAFERTNYCRCVPLYYQDCIALENSFLAIYASFLQSGFVVRQILKCGSGVPMDQAFEKEYNKPAKDQGGITCISCRKEAVAQWNIIKHEKSKFTKHL